jgi:hypothetical protein
MGDLLFGQHHFHGDESRRFANPKEFELEIAVWNHLSLFPSFLSHNFLSGIWIDGV